jgi:beta-1,4-N-acetylglucosaminyltransferase
MPSWTLILLSLAIILLTILILTTARILALLPPRRTKPSPTNRKKGSTPTHLLIVLGSGGHTAEMFALLRDLDARAYNRRTYVFSAGDRLSAEMARNFERGLAEKKSRKQGEGGGDLGDGVLLDAEGEAEGKGMYRVLEVPRARKIHQSLLTTPVSALWCLWACLKLLRSGEEGWGRRDTRGKAKVGYPDLILTNGPSTAVMVVLASFILRFFDVEGAENKGKMRTIYVESWARVKALSLSGRLLLRVVDRFLVQWESLAGAGGRAEYKGVLV